MYIRHIICQICVVAFAFGHAEAAEPSPVAELTDFLKLLTEQRGGIADQAFANVPLTADQAIQARELLVTLRAAIVRERRADEMKSKVIKQGDLAMPFTFKRFGTKPKSGWSLYLSLHGGGGAPKRVNDSQWENQKRLYQLTEGIYLAPRAPTDAWNLWHQGHIDQMFTRLIENMVIFESVDWNRVYVMGYSAGGDGVFQLAPRMSDRWAAAAMMAGHPNETSPLGLRNVPFALQVGGRDSAYNRNKKAEEWKKRLDELADQDPGGYQHLVKIYPDKGHWMDREDAIAIPWMAKFERDPVPSRIVWQQDDVTHKQFYWLGVDDPQPRSQVSARRDGQTIYLKSNDLQQVTVFLDDRMVNLDQPIVIRSGDAVAFAGKVDRTIACIAQTLAHSGDPNLCFSGRVSVAIAGESKR
jgi:hypothetical protein